MNTPPLQKQMDRCAEIYSAVTGFTASRGVCANVQAWLEYLRAGFTPEDLEFVLKHLMRKIQLGERKLACLRISTLILDPQRFSEEIDLARAEQRNRKKPTTTNRDRDMALLRPNVVPVAPSGISARPVADYIAELRKAAQ